MTFDDKTFTSKEYSFFFNKQYIYNNKYKIAYEYEDNIYSHNF